MKKIRNFYSLLRTRLHYSQPVYVPGYEHTPWKNFGLASIVVLAFILGLTSGYEQGGFAGAMGGSLIMLALLGFLAALFASGVPKDRRIKIAVASILLIFIGGAIMPSEDASSRLDTNIKSLDQEQNQKNSEPEPKKDNDTAISSLYQVVSVTDGDTIKVEIGGKTETIRIIGLDTPETKDPRKPVQCFGEEAAKQMKKYVQNKKVQLESDPTQGDRDKYGRLLRYVWLDDGTNIALAMIKNGYAHEYTYRIPHKYKQEFEGAEALARESGYGLWAQNTCNGQAYTSTNTETPAITQPAVQDTSSEPDMSVYYVNCSAARAAGAAPVYAGQPGYGSHLDRDSDGVGCE